MFELIMIYGDEFVSGIPGFNSTTLCKWPTGCLLPVRDLNHVCVNFELFLSDY